MNVVLCVGCKKLKNEQQYVLKVLFSALWDVKICIVTVSGVNFYLAVLVRI